jgi:uncharacterized damage-inducible protein DinB
MITPAYVRTMAAYNAEMNRRLYAAAAQLPDAKRREDGGAFWGSIHATLSHLLWADHMWMARFDDWEKPAVTLAQSGRYVEAFADLAAARAVTDHRIQAWSATLDAAAVAGTLSWFSGAVRHDVTADKAMLLVHLFNHQTHHRGQAHALITRAGVQTGDTDLWLVLPEIMA